MLDSYFLCFPWLEKSRRQQIALHGMSLILASTTRTESFCILSNISIAYDWASGSPENLHSQKQPDSGMETSCCLAHNLLQSLFSSSSFFFSFTFSWRTCSVNARLPWTCIYRYFTEWVLSKNTGQSKCWCVDNTLIWEKKHVGKAFVRLLSNLTSSHHLPMATTYVWTSPSTCSLSLPWR